MCHYVFMFDGRDKTTHSQINSSTQYIYKLPLNLHINYPIISLLEVKLLLNLNINYIIIIKY